MDQGSSTSHPAALSHSLPLAPGWLRSRTGPCPFIPASPSWASSVPPAPSLPPAPQIGVMVSHHRGAKLAKPLTQGKGARKGCPQVPTPSASYLRSQSHPGPAAASTHVLRLPSRRSQRSGKKTSEKLPASAACPLPSTPAEAGWRSQRRALSKDGGAHVPVCTYTHRCPQSPQQWHKSPVSAQLLGPLW